MASLLDTLVAAGLQPLDAHEITLLHREGQAILIEEKALIQSARRGWWAMEKVPNAYKRLLDAQPDAALIKGGPGSGYHAEDGHAGRPGKRGGSASDGINGNDLVTAMSGARRTTLRAPTPDDEALNFRSHSDFAEHPLMKIYLAGEKPNEGETYSDSNRDKQAKKTVVAQLADAMGIDENEANAFIASWAYSSNDNSLVSLGTQEAAAELFGIPLSDWQQEQLDRMKQYREEQFDEHFSHAEGNLELSPEDAMRYTLKQMFEPQYSEDEANPAYPFERNMLGKFHDELAEGWVEINDADDAIAWMARSAENGKEQAKEALSFIYDQTQAAFKAAGITHVKAYRGTTIDEKEVAGHKVDTPMEYTTNALSSWSVSQKVATGSFMDVFEEGQVALGLESIVPVDRIVSFPRTGFGCLNEWEIIIRGNAVPDTSNVYTITRYDDSEDAGWDYKIQKGGPGSGFFSGPYRHGRPGERGGSTSDGINDSDDDIEPAKGERYPEEMRFRGGRIKVEGNLDLLRRYGFTVKDVADVSDLGDGIEARINVQPDYEDGSDILKINGTWFDTKKGYIIGGFERWLFDDGKVAKLDLLYFEVGYLGKGYGTKTAHNWYTKLAENGYEQAKLFADMTIGKYAWAKEGAQYESDVQAKDATRHFGEWASRMKIPGYENDDNLPVFTNPQDVANYQHPDGFTLKGSQIKNREVNPDMSMHIGKAYMLDDAGHGSWQAVINLNDWKGRGKAYKAVTVEDLIGDDEVDRNYVEVGKDIPGASDALFWAQYLEEDEGEPIFNFGESLPDKRGRIIKGGPKSGFHGHAGRPGERGGSKPSGSASRTNLGSIRADAGAGEQVATNDPLFTVIHGNDGWAQAPHHREIPVNYYLPKDNHEKVLKDSVAEQLAADLGIDYGMANEFIHDWAMSSNDSRMESLIHQKLAAAHFGTELTEWQKAQLQNARNKRNKFLNEYIDEMFGWDDSPVLASVTLDHLERQMSQQFGGSEGSLFYPFESDIMRQMAKDQDLGWLKDKAETKAFLRKIERKSESLTKQAIQSIYQRTQEKLAAAGITDLRLYRGTIQKHSQLGSPGDWPEVKLNALSSWSASEYTADQGFAYQNEWSFKEDHTIGTVLAAVVPAKRIYAMPSTGPGALFEWEMIVIGDKSPEPVLVKTTYKDQRKTR